MTPRRRWLRSGPDTPLFQGDGWRWTLSLLMPQVLLWRRRDGSPVTTDLLPLTRAQRDSTREEWRLTQLEGRAQ